jgi:hypothetical protein
MDLASKHPLGGPNRHARRDVADALTDTSSAFRPFFAHGLGRRSARQPVGTGSAQIRQSIDANKRRVK